MSIGIYKIEHKESSRKYIGSSSNVERRLKEHVRKLKNKKHENSYLQSSIDKYGIENFSFEIRWRDFGSCLNHP